MVLGVLLVVEGFRGTRGARVVNVDVVLESSLIR